MTPTCESASGSISEAARSGISVRAQIVFAACGCAGATAFLYAVDPTQHAVYPQCWLYHTTGIYCAGCGATRALHALLHGRFFDALHDNALVITTLPFLLFFTGSYLFRAWQQKSWPQNNVEPVSLIRWAIGLMVVMLIFMAVRNVPGAPFDLLKPLP